MPRSWGQRNSAASGRVESGEVGDTPEDEPETGETGGGEGCCLE